MKKMRDILPASEILQPLEPEKYEKDRIILALEQEGHVPIAVARALMVIEQCEPNDSFPEGASHNPLKLSIYGDPDASGSNEPVSLYIHGDRMGLREIFLQPRLDGSVMRMIPIENETAQLFNASGSNMTQVDALTALAQNSLTGFYSTYGDGSVRFKQDATLEALGEVARRAIQDYRNYLLQLPNVWSGNWDTPGGTKP